MRAEDLFAGDDVALAVLTRVRAVLEAAGPVEERTTKSQVAFRRSRGFAYLWPPARYVRTTVPVVLSVALRRRDTSPRWKEVANPRPRLWIHHLEVRDVDELDDEVVDLLREAAESA